MRPSLLDQLRHFLKQGGELFESAEFKITCSREELVDAIEAIELQQEGGL